MPIQQVMTTSDAVRVQVMMVTFISTKFTGHYHKKIVMT